MGLLGVDLTMLQFLLVYIMAEYVVGRVSWGTAPIGLHMRRGWGQN